MRAPEAKLPTVELPDEGIDDMAHVMGWNKVIQNELEQSWLGYEESLQA